MSAKDGLGEAGLALWEALQATRNVTPAHVPLVLNACRIADNLERISDELAETGLTVKLYDKQGNEINEVANPRLIEHRMQLNTLRQSLGSLGVDGLEVVTEAGKSFKDQLAEAREKRLAREA